MAWLTKSKGLSLKYSVKSDTYLVNSKSRSFFLLPYLSLIFYILAMMPILILSLDAKNTILTANGGGYEVITLKMGYSSFEQLSTWEKYSPFINDFAVSGIIMPALLLLVLLVVKPSYRAYLTAFVTLICNLFLFIQIKCFWQVGSFLPANVLVAGLTETGNTFIADYIKLSSLFKLFILILFSLFSILFARFLDKKQGLLKQKNNTSSKIIVLLSIVGIATSALGNVSLGNEYSNSVLISAFKSFIAYDNIQISEFDKLEPPELLQEFRKFTNSYPMNTKSKYWGKAKDYDVVFIILESVPAQCAKLINPMNELPIMESLIQQSFVSTNHYSTYPYTVRALLSIYSSWYPSNQIKDFIKAYDNRGEKLVAPGVVRSLKEIGYKTAVFVPDYTDNWEHDKQRYEALGFDDQIFPSNDSLKNFKRGDTYWRNNTRIKDEATLVLLKNKITTSLKNNERYLYAYQPQYTHGPWPNVKPGFSIEDTMKECTILMKTVDKWIGEILQLIDKYNRLDKTLIVITADHGIRTNKEHPGFNGGVIDSISFNVPLLLYSPGVIEQTKRIDWLTSHIDIAPSLLSLLGIENGRKYEQGMPIWDKSIKDRYTFFFAKNYLGADAYYYNNNIYMVRHLFKNAKHTSWDNQLSFKAVANTNEKLSREITLKINKMNGLQNNWARMLLPSTMDNINTN